MYLLLLWRSSYIRGLIMKKTNVIAALLLAKLLCTASAYAQTAPTPTPAPSGSYGSQPLTNPLYQPGPSNPSIGGAFYLTPGSSPPPPPIPATCDPGNTTHIPCHVETWTPIVNADGAYTGSGYCTVTAYNGEIYNTSCGEEPCSWTLCVAASAACTEESPTYGQLCNSI